MLACYTGYVVQAIVNNLAPLLFVIFQRQLGLNLGLISALVTVNFAVQMTVDFFSAAVADKLGYRRLMITAHALVIAGLTGLWLFPKIMPPFIGILLSVFMYAVGGGLLEVLVSPILEALPLENKAAAMSLLHSFYCWGHMAVVLLSSLFFALAGTDNWQFLPLLWTIIPLINLCVFTKTPIIRLEDNTPSMPKLRLIRNKDFWVFMIIMVCAGASEQGMSQWASAFAEDGLGISKTLGDLLGPCTFALLMGSSRAFYGKMGEKINLVKFMILCGGLCIPAYIAAALSPFPVFALAGCALCGLCVGIMWPGTFSLASGRIPAGGTAMFAFLALAGDIGCGLGPTLVGISGSIRSGLLMSAVFPVILVLLVLSFSKKSCSLAK